MLRILLNSKSWSKFYLDKGVKVLSGITTLVVILVARNLGFLENWELEILDLALRYRPSELQDPNITLITIDDNDISNLKGYPIEDQELAQLIEDLQQHKPTVIGVDIFRDFSVGTGTEALQKVFQNYPNIVGIEKVLGKTVAPPELVPVSGFVDIVPDEDRNYRRVLLGTPIAEEYRFSFVLHLIDQYLRGENYQLGNGNKDQATLCIYKKSQCSSLDLEIPRFKKNTGAYINEDDGGLQTLVNFRAGKDPFLEISLNDFNAKRFSEKDIENRIVIIGTTSLTIKDFVDTDAVRHASIPGKIYGVEYVAHVVSQITSAVEFGRPLIHTWNETSDNLWLIIWGIISISISLFIRSQLVILFFVSFLGIFVTVAVYILLVQFGFWMPIVPVWIILSGITTITYLYYDYHQSLQNTIKEKQQLVESRNELIEDAFNHIHNGALQTLAETIRRVEQQEFSQEKILEKLKLINEEVRSVKNIYKREEIIDYSLEKLFLQTYTETLNRDFTNFKNLRAKVRSFDEVQDDNLTTQDKERLCQFLQECLCNVGRHADELTRLQVVGILQDGSQYTLKIQDNGIGISDIETKKLRIKFQHLVRSLKAELVIKRLQPKGTLCQLTWKIKKL